MTFKPMLALLLCFTLLAGAPLASAEPRVLDRVIAIVDDGVVLESDLRNRVQTVKSRLLAQGTQPPPDDVLRKRVLDRLILEKIQLQRAERAGMRISDTELNETVRGIAARSGYTLDQFAQAVQTEGLTYREAREQIRREMLVSRIQQRAVEPRVRVTPREIENFLASEASRKGDGSQYLIGHILVAVDDRNDQAEVQAARAKAESILQQLRDGADFRRTAVAQSDGRNALEGGVLGWRREDQLPSLIADVAPGLEVGQPSRILESASGFHIVTVLEKRGGEVKEVEQRRVRHILVKQDQVMAPGEAKERIREIYEQVKAGADFAELAVEHSDDPVSGSDGGNLGWVSPGDMVPAFEQAMMETPVGEVSPPFQSRFGWHILEVLDKRTRDISEETRQAEARQTISRRKYEIELQNWLREIREEAYVQVKDEALEDGA